MGVRGLKPKARPLGREREMREMADRLRDAGPLALPRPPG